MKTFSKADLFFITQSQIPFIQLNHLEGKTVIIDQLSVKDEKKLFEGKIHRILTLFPSHRPIPEQRISVLESIIHVTQEKGELKEEDILNFLEKSHWGPQIRTNTLIHKNIDHFAFIIHPLSQNQIAQIPGLQFLLHTPLMNLVEKIAAKVPGHYYCTITGIKSEFNGKEVEGHLYIIPATPKMLLTTPVEKVYESLSHICSLAHKKGAKLIGLGAYTKIVGDAGITVNQRSPIPVTTGNTLSAAATLWAASYGIEKMRMAKKSEGRYDGTCMVIGATGSIGKICAKVLANQWKKIVVVAPRPYKVMELVSLLKAFAPESEIVGTTNPNKYSGECDLILTSTSARGEKVIDIDLIKPGCVVCDVSRPFDIGLEDAVKRRDILIISSGEIELPGNVKIDKTIGLEGQTVYACLAEAALLTMEGLIESFSISRDLSYEKIILIDRLSRKHGIRLSSIMGHTGEIKEMEIDLCRQYALENLKKWKGKNLP
jgi:predicted amino acid dehydrogenase